MIKNHYIFILSICNVLIFYNCQPEIKQVEFEPYSYKYTIEELQKEFSDEMIAEARMDMEELYEVNASGKYKASFESLDQHKALNGFWMQNLLFFMIGGHIQLLAMESRNGIVPGIRIGIWRTCMDRTLIIIAQPGVKIFKGMILFLCLLPRILMQKISWIW